MSLRASKKGASNADSVDASSYADAADSAAFNSAARRAQMAQEDKEDQQLLADVEKKDKATLRSAGNPPRDAREGSGSIDLLLTSILLVVLQALSHPGCDSPARADKSVTARIGLALYLWWTTGADEPIGVHAWDPRKRAAVPT